MTTLTKITIELEQCELCGALLADAAVHAAWHAAGRLTTPEPDESATCPSCGAVPGQPCRSAVGKAMKQPHAKRGW